MKTTLRILGGSAVGHVIGALREAGIYVVEPGRVDQTAPTSYTVVVDWPPWHEKDARAALQKVEKDYPVEKA